MANLANDYGYGQTSIYWIWHGYAIFRSNRVDFHGFDTLIFDSGVHCSTVAREYLNNHLPNWEKKLLKTKAESFKSASGKMTSIGTIIKMIIIPNRKGNIRLNTEFVVLEDAHIQGFLLGT
ncbi:hypothetical protein O181_123703 [Austropuccinia psidii MF-1]|uniref:Uncharacterized protein n=1 Tax=Austropuccinia psidii MF-1 TaxID=1389203 RepID=A0A9Q3KM83_9BASI|nr:hypothetical protein [Austropuccinia psidii MF-1]